MKTHYIIQSAAAAMPSSCHWFPYKRLAVLEVKRGVKTVSMISPRAKGVIRIVALWEKLWAGGGEKCAFARAKREAEAMVKQLYRERREAR